MDRSHVIWQGFGSSAVAVTEVRHFDIQNKTSNVDALICGRFEENFLTTINHFMLVWYKMTVI